MKIEPQQRRNEPDTNASDRRPYRKPEVLSREELEVMAVACNANPGGKDDGSCTSGFS